MLYSNGAIICPSYGLITSFRIGTEPDIVCSHMKLIMPIIANRPLLISTSNKRRRFDSGISRNNFNGSYRSHGTGCGSFPPNGGYFPGRPSFVV